MREGVIDGQIAIERLYSHVHTALAPRSHTC